MANDDFRHNERSGHPGHGRPGHGRPSRRRPEHERPGHGHPRRDRARAPQVQHDAPTSENISIFGDGDNVLADAVQEGHGRDLRMRKILIACIALLVLYFVALIVPKDMLNEAFVNSDYAAGYTFSWFIQDLQANVNGVIAVFTGNDEGIGYLSTMLRYIVIALSGAGLALCGAIYQGSFRNALVSPSSMGVMSGASAGMMLWMFFYVNDECSNVPWAENVSAQLASTLDETGDMLSWLWASYSLSLYSFVGCFIVAGLVLLVMSLSKKASTSGLMIIITGQVFGGILGAITTCVRYYMTEVEGFEAKLELLNAISVRSFYRDFTLIDIVAVAIPIILCVIVVALFNQRMMVLSFGNEEARAMGVDAKRTRVIVIAVSTFLTAIIISFCGRVGFVGFLIPHLARRMVGPNFRFLLPASMVLGAVFVLGAYLIVSMTLGPTYETMVGMFISIGGAIIFLAQALRSTSGGGQGRGIS